MRQSGLLSLLLACSLLKLLPAQDFSELFSLYQQKNFEALQQKTGQVAQQYQNRDEIKFFKTLFQENGDEAAKIYEQLYLRASGILKNNLGEKLAQYYYARGLYIRAAEFEKASSAAATAQPAIAPPVQRVDSKTVNYVIQVGAFGGEENARQMQKSLQVQKFNARVVERLINERNLFCVWVDGGNSLDETIRLADKIKSRFKLEYRILKDLKE